MPLLAIEVARGTGTSLPTVLAWHVGRILFWHGELQDLAGA
ncbi:hypothetical protein [Bosea sp. BK604]|nr:hypothetical protein [Bosea sp. BK604]